MKTTKTVIAKDIFTITSSKIVFYRFVNRKIKRMSRNTRQEGGSHASPQDMKTILAHRITNNEVLLILNRRILGDETKDLE